VVTTEYSDWATNCPEYKVTAVQVTRIYQKPEPIGKYVEKEKELASTEV
jgi:formate dehydrogenase major subunit